MEKREILERFTTLNDRINLINEKVKSGSCCNGIFVKEFIKCWCEFGENMSYLKDYYRNCDAKVSSSDDSYPTRYWMRDEIATKCRYGLSNLERLLGLTESDFLYEEAVANIYFDFTARCCVGDYDVPSSYAIANLKKEVISDAIGISYDIYSVANGDSLTTGIDNAEIEDLRNEYFLYRGYVGSQTKNYKCDSNGELILCYEGPQFGQELEGLFEYINKCYLEINDKPKKLQKK